VDQTGGVQGSGPHREARDGERHEPVRVLVAAGEDRRAGVTAALRASSFVQVADEARTCQEALAKARAIEPDVVVVDLSLFRELAERATAAPEVDLPELTQRELEVLNLVAQSKTNKDIAGALYISENTVKNHVRNILEKLHLHSRMEAVTYAWQKHLLGQPAEPFSRPSTHNAPKKRA